MATVSSGGSDLISLLLLANVNIEHPIDADLRIGWEELLRELVDSITYVGFVPQLADLQPETPVWD